MPSRLAVRGKNGAIYGRYDKDKRSECTDREKYSRLEKAAENDPGRAGGRAEGTGVFPGPFPVFSPKCFTMPLRKQGNISSV